MTSDTEVVVAFDRMYAHSTRGTPTASRFLTLKALALLGQDWHSPTEILRKLKDMKVTTNTNYIFEITGRFPALAEPNEERLYEYLKEHRYTYVSVGHRSTLLKHHKWLLRIGKDATWELIKVADIEKETVAAK